MIHVIPSIVYWSSLGLVSYTYAGYPMAIMALSRLKRKEIGKKPIEPSITVVMAVHNERNNIGRKLENLLDLDYPREKMDIVVVSDGSDDGTDDIVMEFANKGPVVLKRLETPAGKPSALNLGMESARGELVVFCDARQRMDRRALRELAECFADPEIGAASGELEIESDEGPGIYWKYEKAIRQAEGHFESVPGATGALFAIRRELYKEIPKDALLDDVFTPMNIVLQGYRSVFEPGAKVFDREAPLKNEFRRKARTLAGNYQLLKQLPDILSFRKNPIAWQYISHKVLRLFCPFALGGLLLSNATLVLLPSPLWPFYMTTLVAQLGGYGLAWRGHSRKNKANKLEKAADTFFVLNAAAVEGLRRYLKGDFSWT